VAAIGGLVDTRPHRDAVAHPGLTGTDPDRVRMGLVDGDGADGLREIVEDRLEGGAAVDGLPDAPPRGADVHDARIGIDHIQRRDSAAHDRRADVAGS